MSFASFRGEFAVAGSSGLQLYDASGAVILKESISYAEPVVQTGEKYLLLYDAGGTEYALFTTLACVHRGTSYGAIQCAAVSDTGAYAVVSRASEARCVIALYNASFSKTALIYRESYVTDLTFSPDGKTLAVLGVSASDWSLATTLTLCTVGTDVTKTISLGSLLPLRAQYMRGGKLAVVCDSALLFFDSSGTETRRVPLSSVTLSYFDLSPERIVFACAANLLGTDVRILIWDTDGEQIGSLAMQQKITGVCASSGSADAYLIGEDRLWEIRGGVLQEYECSGKLLDLCEVSGTPILCFSGGAHAAAEYLNAETEEKK
jgi:WD40 repeat protein